MDSLGFSLEPFENAVLALQQGELRLLSYAVTLRKRFEKCWYLRSLFPHPGASAQILHFTAKDYKRGFLPPEDSDLQLSVCHVVGGD